MLGVSRLLVVSNRLPVTLRAGANEPELAPSAGGVATGLLAPHEKRRRPLDRLARRLWDLDAAARDAVVRQCDAACGSCRCDLSADEVKRYYEGYCERRPLAALPLPVVAAPARRRRTSTPTSAVNRRFADASSRRTDAGRHRSGCTTTSCMLVPATAARAAARGAHRLLPAHPVPVVRAVPHAAVARGSCCEGMLGADLVGFHTAGLRAPLRVDRAAPARRRGRRRPRSSWRGREVAARRLPDGRRRDARSPRRPAPPSVRERAPSAARRRRRRGCSSASTGSTTPRASRAGCSPSSALLDDAPGAARARAPRAGGRAVARRRATPTRTFARAGRASWSGRINGALRHAAAGRPCTTSTAGSTRERGRRAVPRRRRACW